MSGISAINSANVAFCGDKSTRKASQKTSAKKDETPKILKPVEDKFKKSYGENAEATPALVADFVADNVVKLGVLVGGGALILAKSRNITSGLTSSLRKNIHEAATAADSKTRANVFKRSVDVVKNTWGDIKPNSLEKAKRTVEQSAKKGEESIKDGVKDAVLRPIEKFDDTSALGKFIDKHCGKHAGSVKDSLKKVGIGSGSDLADTAIAAGSTVALTAGSSEIADDVTSKDNSKLAAEAKIKNFESSLETLSKVADAYSMIAG